MTEENNEENVVKEAYMDGEEIFIDLDADKPPKKFYTNKHKIPNKHRLKHDSIFKGKIVNVDENDLSSYRIEGFDVDKSFTQFTKYDFEEYTRLKKLREQIYDIILEKTEINLKANRRKPGRVDFNNYYSVLITHVDMSEFSHIELFIELAYYFSDNVFNMFKLLEQNWCTIIMKELKQKYKITKIDDIYFS